VSQYIIALVLNAQLPSKDQVFSPCEWESDLHEEGTAILPAALHDRIVETTKGFLYPLLCHQPWLLAAGAHILVSQEIKERYPFNRLQAMGDDRDGGLLDTLENGRQLLRNFAVYNTLFSALRKGSLSASAPRLASSM